MTPQQKDFLIKISPTLQRSFKFSPSLFSLYTVEELYKIAIIDCFLENRQDPSMSYLRDLYRKEIKKEPL